MKNVLKNLFGLSFVFIFALFGVAQAQDNSGSGTTNESSISTNKTNVIEGGGKEVWSASYMNYMNGPTFSEPSGSSINHFFTLKRKFTADWAASVTVRPDSNLGNGEPSWVMSDPFLKLNYPTIYKNENGFKLTGDLIYYLPLSDKSKASSSNGTIAPRLTAAYEIGNLSLMYLLIPKIYLSNEAKDGQKIYSHGHYLSTSYKLNSIISLDFAIYPSWVYFKNKDSSFEFPAYPGATFNISKELSVSPYFEISMLKPENKTTSVGGVLNYKML